MRIELNFELNAAPGQVRQLSDKVWDRGQLVKVQIQPIKESIEN